MPEQPESTVPIVSENYHEDWTADYCSLSSGWEEGYRHIILSRVHEVR